MPRASRKYCLRHLELVVEPFAAFGNYYPVRTTQVTAFWDQMCSNGFVFHPVLQVSEAIQMYYAEISSICVLSHRQLVDFGLLLGNCKHYYPSRTNYFT